MRGSLFTLLRHSALPRMMRWRKGEAVTCLCFHRVSPESDLIWPPLHPSAFEKILKYLATHYAVILPDQIAEKTKRPRIIITFDDGYRDFVEYALPLLIKYRMPAIHHVVVDSVETGIPNWTFISNAVVADHLKSNRPVSLEKAGIHWQEKVTPQNATVVSLKLIGVLQQQNLASIRAILDAETSACLGDLYLPPMMRATDLATCIAEGILIGSHGFSHALLTAGRTDAELQLELAGSRQALETMISRPVTHFAFPGGQYSRRSQALAGQSGYRYLYTTEERFTASAEFEKTGMLIPRLLMPSSTGNEGILYLEGFHRIFR